VEGAVGVGGDTQMPAFPGMRPRDVKTGTGRIRGRVLSSDSGTPLRRAQVRLSGTDINPHSATTDGEGRFDFRDLPPGRFMLSATKSGYVTVQYGQTRAFEGGKPIELLTGQVIDKADLLVPRGSVISGRIVDEFGDPVTDANVAAMRSGWSNGRRRLQHTGRTSMTNDLGQFRLYGLPAGDYYVSATLRDPGMMEMSFAVMGGPTPPSGSGSAAGYAPTYFPGTPNGADAQKITIAAGQDAPNTDFALLPVRLARIAGVVVNSEGKPVDGSMVNISPRGGEAGLGMMGGGAARTGRDGAFTISGIAPGDYVLQTHAMRITTSGSGDAMTVVARFGGTDSDAESGSLPISVGGEDIANVVIATTRGATASGRLTFEAGATPASLTNVGVMAIPTTDDSPMSMGGVTSVKPDGSFEIHGLSGMRMFRVNGLRRGLAVKAVLANGVDVTDTGVEFKAGEALTGMEILATAKTTEISGTVKDAAGAALKDFTVVVFSTDPQRWALPNSRYVAGARPDQEGRFHLADLPPGSYYAAAVDYLVQGEWEDPEILDSLKGRAVSVRVDEGEKKAIDLKLVER
jgi:uncharacterized protein (DUF2141 family)